MGDTSGGYYNFVGAPPRNLPFPAGAHMTAVELLTLLPNCLTSPDVVLRFVSNRMTRDALLSILYTNRILEADLGNLVDYVLRSMRNAMRANGHEGWTLSEHWKKFQHLSEQCNAASLSVGGFRTLYDVCEYGKKSEDVPFTQLAEGVKKMPQGDDALDLTRMVQYCVENPEEGWRYPTHYDELLRRLDRSPPTAANEDREIFTRWKDIVPHVSRQRRSGENTPQPKVRAQPQKGIFGTFGQTAMQTPEHSSPIDFGSQGARKSNRQARPSLKKRELLEGIWRSIHLYKPHGDNV